ncbi:TonB-dependent siderophore receptor [Candidatus Methylobacter oryzae]|uniref:TonB-dependent siderophore receptor n=1 Tax=Candidatus Methylobacter oryzae TaxID=2497749 RepID=A0ABY3CHQ2_9GAMM|nr:TonB-dependent siderophore receptor [Candidatus Methylobacter oryzae]TRX03881.1 TonB-dependent siderophore receptor [Candidatus Methylobacter oryzae]
MLRTAINVGRSTVIQKQDEFTECGSSMIRADRKIKAHFPSCIFIFAMCYAVSGQAEPVDKVKVFKFNIPAEDMASALIAFSETTEMQLIYPAALVQNLKSKALYGSYKPEQALQKLLADSNIVYRYGDNDAISLTEAPKGEGSGTTTLKAMTVIGKASYADNDPYNPNYNRTTSTTATKTDTPIMLTPASIQVVPKAVMNDQQNINILDSLNRNVSGVSARTGSGVLYDNFIIRGFTTGLTGNAYRNGLLFPSNFYEPSNIEQLEVLKGPAAALYGRIEPGGVVNITTKKPLATPYYALQQQFGSYDLYRTTVDATGPIDDAKTLLYRFNATYLDKGSFKDMVNSDRVFIAPTLSWRPNDKFEANLELEYKHDNFVNDYGVPVLNGANRPVKLPSNTFLGDSAANRGEQENVLIGFDWKFNFNDNWKLTNRFLWEDWSQKEVDIIPMSMRADNRTLNRGLFKVQQSWETFTTNLDLNGRFDLFGTRHDILIGGDFYNNKWPGSSSFSGAIAAVPGIDIYNPVHDQVSQAAIDRQANNSFQTRLDQWFGVYFQDQITLWNKLHIMGGGRYDWSLNGRGTSTTSVQQAKNSFSDVETQNFSPRVGLLYQPWQWLSVYGNYTQSFNGNSGFSATGKQFDPQIGEQYEAGFKTEFFDKKLSTSVAFYHLTKSNTLTPDPANRLFNLAIGEARSKGIEVDIKGQVTEKLNLITTYAFTDTRITKDNNGNVGKELVNVPDHQASVWGTYQLTERFKVGLGEVLVGSRQGDTANTYQLPGYARTDAMAAYIHPIGKTRLTTQLNINNLLNKDYFSESSLYNGGRVSVLVAEPISVMGSLKLEY